MSINTDNAQFLREFLGNNHKGELAMTLRLIGDIDDEAMTLRLADGLPTIATHLHHTFSSGPWFLSVVRRHHADWSETTILPFTGNVAALLNACRQYSQEAERLIASFSVDELVAEVDFNSERFPAVYMIDWHTVYLVHHRAMVVSTLLRHGLKPHSFYGPVNYV